MKLFRIYCGQRPQDGCFNELDLERNGKTARRLAAQFFPLGHTVIEATGQWAHFNGTHTITEPTTVIEVLIDTGKASDAIYEMARAYKEAANQESVMVLTTEVNANFV